MYPDTWEHEGLKALVLLAHQRNINAERMAHSRDRH